MPPMSSPTKVRWHTASASVTRNFGLYTQVPQADSIFGILLSSVEIFQPLYIGLFMTWLWFAVCSAIAISILMIRLTLCFVTIITKRLQSQRTLKLSLQIFGGDYLAYVLLSLALVYTVGFCISSYADRSYIPRSWQCMFSCPSKEANFRIKCAMAATADKCREMIQSCWIPSMRLTHGMTPEQEALSEDIHSNTMGKAQKSGQ
jgi:hypothetical protein